MKKVIITLLTLLLSLTTSTAVQLQYNGLWYSIYNNKAKVISSSTGYSGDIVIPSHVWDDDESYVVTDIGYGAFSGCNGLTSISIPNSVTYIGEFAFSGCTSLSSVVIGSGVSLIDSGAFKDCDNLKSVYITDLAAWCKICFEYDGNGCANPLQIAHHLFLNGTEIKNLIIPNSVTSIGQFAFYGGSSLTSIMIPNSVTSIGNYAFDGCSGLTSVTIPNSVTSIESSSFRNCSGLTSIVVESGNIKYDSRANCNAIIETSSNKLLFGLKNTIIPNSVTSIGDWAFDGCSGLTSISIPNSVTSIGYGAFWGTGWYNNQPDGLVYAGKVAYTYKGTMPNNTSIIIKDGTVGITDHAFSGCTSLTSITIPNSVTSIGGYAFYNCSGLTSVTIPNSITSIGNYAFDGCSGLTTIVTEIENPFAIDDYAFYSYNKDIYATATLIVPPGKKSAYQNTAGWSKFQNIIEVGGVGYEFEADGVRYKIGESNTVSVVSKDTYYSGDINIPSQTSYQNTSYKVTSIGNSAFEGCANMTSVSLPSSLINIGKGAFWQCTSLKSVVIPNGVTTIGEGAFSKCEGLASVTIPGGVTSIGKNVFFQCYGLTQITSLIENPFAIDDGVFPTSVYNNASLTVPIGKKSAYQNTAGWKQFQNIIEANGVGMLFEADGIRYKIGENNTVSVVSKDTHYSGDIYIPSQTSYQNTSYKVTSIGNSAFEGCANMTSVSLPSSLINIGKGAFWQCVNLKSVDIPDGVTTIGEGAFSKCEGLAYVTIPASVTSIGKNAFFQCNGLTQITSLIENPFAIDDGVFPTSVYNNASLFVLFGTKSAYQNTSGWKRFQNIVYVDGLFTMTYYVDGAEYKSVKYKYGEEITPEPAPAKEGYTFSGWSYIPSTMPAEEVNVVGSFTINQYNITYMIDGEKYASETVDFNSKIVPPTPPSKDGFDFAWEEYPETMPAHDITINGAYTTTGILSIAVESGKAKIFTLDGRQVDTPQKGINIIRMDDGTIKKVVLSK